VASYRTLHDWNVTPTEAVHLQQRLRSQLRIEPLDREIRTIAGCDISFNRFSETVFAGAVVLSLPDLQIVERKGVETIARFPYVPGLLSFREIPALLGVWEMLETEPDAVMIDGQGYAHPRRMGFASHFGLVVDRPTVGCAKSILVGRHEEPGPNVGDWAALVHGTDTIGAAFRTKARTKPVYISIGNRIDLPGALGLSQRCLTGYRIPEPTRQAHLLVNELRRAASDPQ
jgi:deoxyribonuclease V